MDRREHYRVAPLAADQRLHASLQADGGEAFEVEIVDLTRNGIAVRVKSCEESALEPRQAISLHLCDDRGSDIPDIPCEVRSIVRTPGFARYGLRFRTDRSLEEILPPHLLPRFNQRVARRIEPLEPVAVELERSDGRRVSGRVRDLSWSGLGVAVPAGLEDAAVDRVQMVAVRFRLAGISQAFCLKGYVQRDLLVDSSVCYGIRFDAEASEDFAAQQAALKRYVAQCFVRGKQAQGAASGAPEAEPGPEAESRSQGEG